MRTNSSNKALLAAFQKSTAARRCLTGARETTHCPEVRSRHVERISPCACRAVQLAEIRPKTAAGLEDLSGLVECMLSAHETRQRQISDCSGILAQKLAVQGRYKISMFPSVPTGSLQGIRERPLPCIYNVFRYPTALSRR